MDQSKQSGQGSHEHTRIARQPHQGVDHALQHAFPADNFIHHHDQRKGHEKIQVIETAEGRNEYLREQDHHGDENEAPLGDIRLLSYFYIERSKNFLEDAV